MNKTMEANYELAKEYALRRLENELSPELTYHTPAHTRDGVLPAAERLAEIAGIEDEESLLLLRTAAVFHDIGYIETGTGHEQASIRIAKEVLPGFGYTSQQIEQIQDLIIATIVPQKPKAEIQRILVDADLDVLGREDFFERSQDLRAEFLLVGREYTNEEWYRFQIQFLQRHRYFSQAAITLREPGKQRNIERLQELLAGPTSVEERVEPLFMNRKNFEQIICRVPLFRHLPDKEIECLALNLKPVEFPEDTILFLEGDHGEHFYIIIKGEVEIIMFLGTIDERLLGVRGAGEFIGEMSLINLDGRRTASTRTRGAVLLLEMTRADFDALLLRNPMLAYEMLRVQGERLNESNIKNVQDLQEINQKLVKSYGELKDAQDSLVENERLKKELEVASDIQCSILPWKMPDVEGYEIGGLMIPAREVGGDFYDLFPFSKDKLGIVIGDITDKGVPAAIFMAQTHSLVRAAASPNANPATVLQKVNRQLREMNRRGLFATVLYGILDSKKGQFTYARAGHEPPILILPGGQIIHQSIKPGLPLGLFAHPNLDLQTVDLTPGTTMVLITDGVTDALIDISHEEEKEDFDDILRREVKNPAQDLCYAIDRALYPGNDDALRVDDVTLITVKSLG